MRTFRHHELIAMAYFTQSSSAFFAFALCISLYILPPVYCAMAVFPDGDELVRITFNPPANNTAAWTAFDDTATNRHAIQTSNEQATISLAFRGTSISPYYLLHLTAGSLRCLSRSSRERRPWRFHTATMGPIWTARLVII